MIALYVFIIAAVASLGILTVNLILFLTIIGKLKDNKNSQP